jgi:uncharacterized protein (TIGR03435 family)
MAARLSLGIALVVASGIASLAQSLPAPPGPNAPRFEVASVKRNMTDPTKGAQGPLGVEPGRFISIGWPLRSVITMTYGARSFQIVGAPAWVEKDLFDINAKAAENMPAAEILPMVRALLADRFKLRAHLEKREMPIYALVVAREGRLGPGMKPTTENCAQVRADRKALQARPGEFSVCASRLTASPVNGTLVLEMAEGGMSVPSFIKNVSSYVDRLVIDRTGLTGDFDFLLQFQPPGGLSATSANGVPSLDGAPPFLEAIQRQLGLKLQSDRAPVDVLVIDSVEPPTPD